MFTSRWIAWDPVNPETLAIEGNRIRKEAVLSNIFLELALLKEIVVDIACNIQ